MMIRLGLIVCELFHSMLPPSQLSPVGVTTPGLQQNVNPEGSPAADTSAIASLLGAEPSGPATKIDRSPRTVHPRGRTLRLGREVLHVTTPGVPPVGLKLGSSAATPLASGGNKRSITAPPGTSPARTMPCVTRSMHRA